jgi:hypothetical protein
MEEGRKGREGREGKEGRKEAGSASAVRLPLPLPALRLWRSHRPERLSVLCFLFNFLKKKTKKTKKKKKKEEASDSFTKLHLMPLTHVVYLYMYNAWN